MGSEKETSFEGKTSFIFLTLLGDICYSFKQTVINALYLM